MVAASALANCKRETDFTHYKDYRRYELRSSVVEIYHWSGVNEIGGEYYDEDYDSINKDGKKVHSCNYRSVDETVTEFNGQTCLKYTCDATGRLASFIDGKEDYLLCDSGDHFRNHNKGKNNRGFRWIHASIED